MKQLKKLIVLQGEEDIGKSTIIQRASHLPDNLLWAEEKVENGKDAIAETVCVKERFIEGVHIVVAYASAGDNQTLVNGAIEQFDKYEKNCHSDKLIEVAVFVVNCGKDSKEMMDFIKNLSTCAPTIITIVKNSNTEKRVNGIYATASDNVEAAMLIESLIVCYAREKKFQLSNSKCDE